MQDLVGQQLGNYRLIRQLGQGTFADVYLGEHCYLKSPAALKVLRVRLADEDAQRFLTEARTLVRLSHPNIVRVLDFGVENSRPFLVMEYAPNGALRQRHTRGVPLSVEVIVPYIKQVAAALQHAHNQKLIHHNIKPENMLLGSKNEVLLSDFGIAVMTQSVRAQHPTDQHAWNPTGTVAYMAPEQIQGQTVPASDQYALAIVVYEWLTGVLPFNGSYMETVSQQVAAIPLSLRAKVPTVSPYVEQVVLKALAKDPQKRFGRIEAFAHALEQATQFRFELSVPVAQPSGAASLLKSVSEVLAMEASLIGPLGRTVLVLGSTRLTIGRAKDNRLVVTDPKASAHHAEIRPQGQSYNIVDLNSMNGTFVNDQQLSVHSPRQLRPGDMIRIGDMTFSFAVTSSAQAGGLSSNDSTVRVTPPPQSGAAANFGINTSYGGGAVNYGDMPSHYGETPPPAQPQLSSYTLSQPSQPRSMALTTILAVVALVIILGGFFVIHNNLVALIQNSSPPVSSSPISLPTVSLVLIIIIVALFLIGAIWFFIRQRRLADVAEITQTQPRTAKRTQLALFSIARARLENGDKAYIDKTYSVEAGISRRKFGSFKALPFDLFIPNMHEPIQFDISLHAGNSVELTSEWQKDLRYDPQNTKPQLVEFPFKVIAPGPCSLTVDFYRERHLLQTISIEFEAVEQPTLATTTMEG